MKKIAVFIIATVFAFSYISNTLAEQNQHNSYNRRNSILSYIKNNIFNKNKKQNEEFIYDALPDTIYTFSTKNSSEECSQNNPLFCAVENTVKCTVNPDIKFCKKLNLPKFIFIKDSSVDRPNAISYKIIDRKLLPNNTVEIYTESACNGEWFGLCQGTIIYWLTKVNETWQVKDIYALE